MTNINKPERNSEGPDAVAENVTAFFTECDKLALGRGADYKSPKGFRIFNHMPANVLSFSDNTDNLEELVFRDGDNTLTIVYEEKDGKREINFKHSRYNMSRFTADKLSRIVEEKMSLMGHPATTAEKTIDATRTNTAHVLGSAEEDWL